MRYKIYLAIGLFLFSLGNVQAKAHEISIEGLRTHVKFLTSDSLEGRLTGSKGEKLAAQYVADIFYHLGLEPAGDQGTYFQTFNFPAGVSLGKNNLLSITNQNGVTKHLILNQDWRPLPFSDNAAFETTEFVLAGYGISAPALGKLPSYDSYQGLNVKNKWVIVFRYVPEKISDEQSRQLSQYASLRYKAFIAKQHGAKGIIFVSGPNSNVKKELISLSFAPSLSGSGIVALSVKDAVINNLLISNNLADSLKKLQDSLDYGQLNALPTINRVKVMGHVEIKKIMHQGRSVLAKLKTNADAGQMIVVGAHVDHLGRGELSGSRAQAKEMGMIHPGADDNASGVASMLEVAALLTDLKAHGKLPGNKNILFAAWSGEEFGILGSSHFVANFMKTNANKSLHRIIDAAINLDMVGHLREKLVLQGVGSSTDWPKLIESIKVNNPIPLILQADPYLPTDSTAFYLHGVPTINFFTGAHDNYHSPRDKAETLNYQGLKKISTYLIGVILALEARPGIIDFHEVQKPNVKPENGLKVYLGTIPDYTSENILGVKLSGVTKNSPSEQGGIKRDDVIVELAGKKIHDIYDYTYVLNALHVGQPAKMVVRRGQSKIVLIIIPRYRI